MKNREYMVIYVYNEDELCIGDISVFTNIKDIINYTVNMKNINFHMSKVVISGRRFTSRRNLIPLNVFLSSIDIDEEDKKSLSNIGFEETNKKIDI